MWLNWKIVSTMPWRQRNAEVSLAVQMLLNDTPANVTRTTMQMAQTLTSYDGPEPIKLAQLLSKMAPHMPGYALQGGEQITRGGRTWRRWNWYGQDRGAL